MPLGRDDIIASYFTLTGAGVMDPPRFTFEERVAAAAAAGFSGIGLMGPDYEAIVAGGAKPADLRAIVDHHGIVVAEIEFLMDWHADGDRAAEARRAEETFYAMADLFGSRHMNLGILDPHSGEIELASPVRKVRYSPQR